MVAIFRLRLKTLLEHAKCGSWYCIVRLSCRFLHCICHQVVERVFEKWLHIIVTFDKMSFDFMPERGTIDSLFMLTMLQEEYHAKGKKLYMCFVDVAKVFDRVPRTVLKWAMRRKGMPEVLV